MSLYIRVAPTTFNSIKYQVRNIENRLLSNKPQQQSRLLPGPERIRASKFSFDPNNLLDYSRQSGTTSYEIFHNGWKLSNNGPCLGTRNKESGKYEWLTYSETWDRALNFGSALQEFGISAGQKSVIGINCKNSTEFVVSYMGTSAYSSIFVPFYDHLNEKAINYIISRTGNSLFVADTEVKAKYIISQKSQHFPDLNVLVLTCKLTSQIVNEAKNVGIQVISYTDLERLGKNHRKKIVIPKTDDIFAICWTSGTSGEPKGVPMAHQNFAATINSVVDAIKPVTLDEVSVISYMPTGHAYEIAAELQTLAKGGKIGFFGGDIFKLMDDIQELKPNYIPMVPRLLNRIHSIILASVKNDPFKKRLLHFALSRKEKLLRKGIVSKSTIWDKFVLKKIRDLFGGEVEIITSSAAPLDPKVKMFFRCALGCHFFNGYGQTETSGVSFTTTEDLDGDSVGAPLPSCLVKLIDVPEMNYFSKNDIGEICVKGPSVFKGYYKNPKADKETFRDGDWAHTGDIGRWLPDGTLQIVDRKNNLFKLSQGEFLSPDKIENVYVRHPLLAQIYVDGLSDKDYLVCIAVPDPTVFMAWAKDKGFKQQTIEELCEDLTIRKKVLRRLRKFGKNGGLTSLEQVKNVHLHPKLFSIEDGFLTPTLKTKRNVIKKHFNEVIKSLYSEEPTLISRNET